MHIPLIEKYRPRALSDLVLPKNHDLAEATEYMAAPYPSAWLSLGKPGLGKTSLAHIMADKATQGCELSKHVYSGPDLAIDTVRDIARTCSQRPLPGFGLFHAFLVDEADCIPKAAQIRLLALLEGLRNAVFLFTSNESTDDYESRFLSRVKILSFTSQGVLAPATQWLIRIADAEGIPLHRSAAERIIKDCRTNLRASLQVLDSLGAQARAKQHPAPPMVDHQVKVPEIACKTPVI